MPRVSLSSNVGQNYPYASETETARAAAIAAAVGQFAGLGDRIAAESTPVGPVQPEELWWIWVCPVADFTGRLHVAGYALERHALYTACDTCGQTFLR